MTRYRDVFESAWRARRTTLALYLTADEADFSPPALALEQRPVSPSIRVTAGLLVALLVIAIAWSALGRVDIVVIANGKLIPSSRTKTIAAVDTAVVREIHVVEGQSVKAGDVLLELDSTPLQADREKAFGDAASAKLQLARSQALIQAIRSHRQPLLADMPGVNSDQLHEAQLHLTGQYRDFTAKLAQADSDIQQYTQAWPIAFEREGIYQRLLQNQDVPRDAWLEKKQQRMEIEAHLAASRHARDVLIEQAQRTAYDAITDASKSLADSAQDAIRAGSHANWLELRAPVDGTIQQLSVHTVGGVVQAAQPIMLVVPAEKHVEVEAFLSSKDVGFVAAGYPAQVKIDAFDYTKYGTVAGRVVSVSPDSIPGKENNLSYAVRVLLDQPHIEIQGHSVLLTPGMSASVEIKTGDRRIIEYLFSPLLRHQHESLHER